MVLRLLANEQYIYVAAAYAPFGYYTSSWLGGMIIGSVWCCLLHEEAHVLDRWQVGKMDQNSIVNSTMRMSDSYERVKKYERYALSDEFYARRYHTTHDMKLHEEYDDSGPSHTLRSATKHHSELDSESVLRYS